VSEHVTIDARSLGDERVVIEFEPSHHARTEVLDDDVRRQRECPRRRATLAARQVEDDGALVAVEGEEVRGVVADERRPPGAGVVAAVRSLDLDHVRAEVAQQHRGERPGEHA
jgi:hypothetical protein